MILPIIVGYLAGKSYGKNLKVIMISLIVGILMGICGGLELIPFAYPLYATRPLDWVGLPEYRPIAIYFGFPFFKLYQEVVLMTDISAFVISILTGVCVLGVLIGYSIGNRAYKKKDQVWSADEK
jgi:hypothetical protein